MKQNIHLNMPEELDEFEVTKTFTPDNPEYQPQGIFFPFALWKATGLTIQEKAFLVEIKCLDSKQGCYASNKHFAELFGISKPRASAIITSLKEKGLINVKIHRKGKQVIKRVLRFTIQGTTIYGRGYYDLQEVKIRDTKAEIQKNKRSVAPATDSAPNQLTKKKQPKFAGLELSANMDRYEFHDHCKKSTQRRIRLIGWFAKDIQEVEFDTAGEWQIYFKRNLRPATDLAKFSNDRIMEACDEVKNSEYITEFSMETIIKHLTNGKTAPRPAKNQYGRVVDTGDPSRGGGVVI